MKKKKEYYKYDKYELTFLGLIFFAVLAIAYSIHLMIKQVKSYFK